MRVLLVDERVHRRGHLVLVRGTEKADDEWGSRVPNALLCVAEKRPVLNGNVHQLAAPSGEKRGCWQHHFDRAASPRRHSIQRAIDLAWRALTGEEGPISGLSQCGDNTHYLRRRMGE